MRAERVLFFVLLLSVAGCDSVVDTITHPKPYGIKTTMPGPPDFTKGWEDGCFTGMATMSNSYYQTFYHFRQDPTMTTNKMYYQAWKDSYAYCRQYVLKFTHETLDNADFSDPNK